MTQFTPIEAPERNDLPLPVVEQSGSRFGKAHHILLLFAGIAFVVWLLSGIYKVNPGEVAIVERLGQYLGTGPGGTGRATLVEPGPHYALPWPIDTIHKISTHQTRILTVDAFNTTPAAYEDFKREFIRENPGINLIEVGALFDPYLITADKNIIHMAVAVQYTVDDPEAWLTTASHESNGADEQEGMREAIFQQVVQHAMIHMVSNIPISNILFEGREKLPGLLMKAVTDAMALPNPDDPTGASRISLGIHVERVDLVQARPPQYVQPAFDQVTQARADMVRTEAKANADANAAVTQAHAAADTMLSDADAYNKQVVESATGEASRFQQVLDQYHRAPDVTRYNLYTDAIRTIAAAANRLMFVEPGQQATLTIDPPKFDANQIQPSPAQP